ncbi:MAG: orotidine 5'-phosphate decarboxylase [Omnitrophica WOR_2 bacterium GWF2_43_52]|nr:MAG: orotidine 5'-phosphate decarboxylase [Omnitrophica WOR_2 bacterium GWC2_44_8]OGX20620.1 MAG: orotidine 5'-phosphate decarboxylase [Omnitrophica WOR_2 bacterium GWF2_43_52]
MTPRQRRGSPKAAEPSTQKLILALDVDTFSKAKYFVNLLYPKIRIFKVGSQLFTGSGPKIIEFIHKKGAQVFLDLKFYDIPNTVANAVRQAARLEVKMLTLHISGGEQMLKEAVKAAKSEALRLKVKRPLLVGVTVLTSQEASREDILRLAKSGLSFGLDGVVCSAQEVKFLRENIKEKCIIVTPGIRPKTGSRDDQKRIATAPEALKAGSSFLVVGRPILEAKDPQEALKGLW